MRLNNILLFCLSATVLCNTSMCSGFHDTLKKMKERMLQQYEDMVNYGREYTGKALSRARTFVEKGREAVSDKMNKMGSRTADKKEELATTPSNVDEHAGNEGPEEEMSSNELQALIKQIQERLGEFMRNGGVLPEQQQAEEENGEEEEKKEL